MKLSEYAKKNSISYGTAYRHFKTGLVKGKQLPTGTIVIEDEVLESNSTQGEVALYARVSSSENKANLDTQMERLKGFATSLFVETMQVGLALVIPSPKLAFKYFEASLTESFM